MNQREWTDWRAAQATLGVGPLWAWGEGGWRGGGQVDPGQRTRGAQRLHCSQHMHPGPSYAKGQVCSWKDLGSPWAVLCRNQEIRGAFLSHPPRSAWTPGDGSRLPSAQHEHVPCDSMLPRPQDRSPRPWPLTDCIRPVWKAVAQIPSFCSQSEPVAWDEVRNPLK